MELFHDLFFYKFHKKTPVPESIFNKVTDWSLSPEVVAWRCFVKKYATYAKVCKNKNKNQKAPL